jgi:Gas vesicle synthesis protein GvpL/GvpF
VESLPCSGFVCWISRVDPKEYGEELQAHMENLDWLAGASVRHQKVVGAIHEQSTILPARFATLFLSGETLGADVKRRSAELKKDLKRLSGSDEYGVKIFGIPQSTTAVDTSSSGRDYLQRKSAILRERTPVSITPQMEKFVAKLRDLASQVAEGGSVTSGQRHLLWQGSFLLPRARRKQLEAALAAFHTKQSERYRVECTGPWPPYSFVAIKANAKGE